MASRHAPFPARLGLRGGHGVRAGLGSSGGMVSVVPRPFVPYPYLEKCLLAGKKSAGARKFAFLWARMSAAVPFFTGRTRSPKGARRVAPGERPPSAGAP